MVVGVLVASNLVCYNINQPYLYETKEAWS